MPSVNERISRLEESHGGPRCPACGESLSIIVIDGAAPHGNGKPACKCGHAFDEIPDGTTIIRDALPGELEGAR